MARAVFVTCLIALSVHLTSAYSKGCAVGPAYWCQSFQNAQDCGALRHCTDTVWRYDAEHTAVDSSTTCEWCQKILENTHKGIQNLGTNQELIKSTLIDGCKLLPLADISSKCTAVMETYGTSVLSLMNHQRYDTVCHLMNICPSEMPVTEQPTTKPPLDEESMILCNVIVRATHDLHANQHKSRNEIQTFLRDDCQHLATQQLIHKCEDLVEHRGHDIFAHVASNVELSKVCGHLDDFVDHSTSLDAAPVHCELCSFVLSTAKYMLDAKHSEENVLSYIDEQVCSRLTGAGKKACKDLVLNKGKDLLDSIRSGTRSMLLCTRFQICLDQILDKTSPVQKEEMRSFLTTNFCDKLGSLKDVCYAMIDKDTTRVLQSLVSSASGNELCRIFGLCPTNTPLLTTKNLQDDPNKCDRCVKDFTRRKHIAERLVNHSSEFLHHLCGQLPNKDDCIKAIDGSFSELLTFIRSMDPKEICIQLKMCDQSSLVRSAAYQSDNILNEEIIQYMKNDICPRLGLTSALCLQLVDSEASALLDHTSKRIDPHRICEILDVCPSNMVIKQCQDKCQCCKNKIEIYQLKLEKFLRTVVASTRTMCNYMPAHDVCAHLADVFESNVDNLTSQFNSQKICQLLTLCPSSEHASQEDQCQTCQAELNTRQDRFRSIVSDVTAAPIAACTDNACRASVRSAQQKALSQIDNFDSKTLCQQLGYCVSDISFEPSPIQLRLRNLVRHQTQSLDQRLAAHDVCSTFGQLKPICEHLLASPQGHRYAYVYQALLQNNQKLVDDDLREQLVTKANADVCTACKNAVQSGKDFWINSLDVVHDILLQACERCPSKDQCRDYYNQRFESIKSYLESIDSDQFCQSLRLCSSAVTKDTDRCSACVDRLTSRRESLLRAVTRLTAYFDDICQRFELKPCQVFVQQIQQSVQKMIKSVDPREACTQIGFCSTTTTSAAGSQVTFEQYEKYLVDAVEKEICSTLGPFESLCKQIIHGNSEQIQTVKINYNMRDLMQIGEGKNKHLFSASSESACAKDRCQCCIDRVDQKKKCVKDLGDNLFSILIKSCDYCPSKDQCRQFWKDSQTQFESCVDGCDSKQICTRIGFCNASNLCAKMGVFQEECEQTLNKFIQSSQEDLPLIEQHLPHTSVVVLPVDKQEQKQVDESNATCILCEYMMNILSSYIHQHSTEEEIEAGLTKVCQQMPHSLQQQCHEFVDNYGPVIIATLINRFDVGSVCRNLNLCTKQMTVNVSHLSRASVASCGICDYVSTYVHFALKRDGSEKSLEQALKSVCVHLSAEQQSQCQTLVQLFGPHMRQLQLNLGENFCQQLPMCQTPMTDLKPAVHLPEQSLPQQPTVQQENALKEKVLKNLDGTPQCALCHYIVSYLDAFVKNNKSEAAVEEALTRVCTVIPRKDRVQCNEFVKAYGPVLTDLLFELADPSLVCRYLGLCQVVLPEETTTQPSKPVTYGNHQYARIPV